MNKKKFYIMFLFLIGIILITVGTAYSWFSYRKEGTKTVAITTRSVKLHYEENNLKKINLTNALPMSNELGKNTDYFEFTITSETAMFEIPYYVTARIKTQENIIPKEYITLYLTEVIDNVEVERLLTTYDNLITIEKNNHLEEKIYNTIVPAETNSYEKVYRLRMWINENADYSPQIINNETVYPMQDKEFAISINVYTEDGTYYVEPEGEYIREICEETIIYDSDKTYKIKTAEDLACFSKLIKEETYFNNANTVVVSNVDLNQDNSYFYMTGEKSTMYGDINEDGEISILKTELTTGKGFYPIGKEENNRYFKGTLEGNGFTISNLKINRPDENYVGLFGYSGATIQNINIDGFEIIGKDYIGSLVGRNNKIISNIIADNIKVSGNNYIGGLVGINSTNGVISLVHINSTVSGNGYVGGLIGDQSYSTTQTCWITSKVTGDNHVGGIVGNIDYGAVVNEMVASVEVTGNSTVGGAAGYSRDGLKNVLLKKAVVTGTESSTGGAIGYGYAKGVLIEKGSSNKAPLGNCELCQYLETFTAESTSDYKYLLGTKNVSGYENSIDTIIGGDNDNSGWYFRQDNEGEFELVKVSDYPIVFNLEGSGTEASPYLIHNADEWNMATIKANVSGIVFKLVNDIDFTGKEFYKMGSGNNKFNGTLDGNNKTISGIFLDGGSFSGLIGYNGINGEIKDLTLSNITIDKAFKYNGILIGYNEGSKMSNILIKDSQITNSNYAGGAVGNNTGTVTDIVIENVAISNGDYLGGLVGNNGGTIKENIVDVEVTGSNYIGGLVGYQSYGTTHTCWVTSKVTGISNVGGIIGSSQHSGSLYEVVASVEVKGNNTVGGVAGYAREGVKDILLKKSVVNGTENSTGGATANGYSTMQGVIIESGSSNKNALGNCYECYYLETFTALTNEDYKYLLGTKNVSGYENALDTIIGGDNDNSGWYFRQDSDGEFYLVKVSDYPIVFNLEGSGTESNPYLIHNADEWNMATIKANVSGVVFKLVNDIDFTGKEFYKMGSFNNKFNGILDGNNKTISGIFLDGGSYSGLIGYNGPNGEIKDLTLSNITIDKAFKYSGILIGYNEGSKMSNILIKDSKITNSNYAGGAIGYNKGTVSNIIVENVTLSNGDYLGGLTGYNGGTVKENKVDVTISGGNYLGGLVGYQYYGTTHTNWVTSKVTGDSSVGGVVGSSQHGGLVYEIVASVEVTGNSSVGGAVGYTREGANNILLRKSIVTGTDNNSVGGAIGYSYSSSSGMVIETGSSNKNALGYNCGQSYYLSTFTAATDQTAQISSSYYNDLTKYDDVLETSIDGDTNSTGWYFGYDQSGTIDLISAN